MQYVYVDSLVLYQFNISLFFDGDFFVFEFQQFLCVVLLIYKNFFYFIGIVFVVKVELFWS